MEKLLSSVTGLYGIRFISTLWIPAFLFIMNLFLLVLFVGRDLPDEWKSFALSWHAWNQWSGQQQIAAAILFIIGVTFIALLLENTERGIARLYEGYPWKNSRIGQFIIERKRKSKDVKLKNISDRTGAKLRELERITDDKVKKNIKSELIVLDNEHLEADTFPAELPTRIGNIYKAGELYPYRTYGIDPITFWPCIWHLLPANLQKTISGIGSSVFFLLLTSLLGLVFALLAIVYIFFAAVFDGWTTHLGLALLWPSGGLLVFYLSYLAALGPASDYARHIGVAFDLYRQELAEQLGLDELTTKTIPEQGKWETLGLYIRSNTLVQYRTHREENSHGCDSTKKA